MDTAELILYDEIIVLNIATYEEIDRARECVEKGSWRKALKNILYVRTGCHTIQEYFNKQEEAIKILKQQKSEESLLETIDVAIKALEEGKLMYDEGYKDGYEDGKNTACLDIFDMVENYKEEVLR